MESSTTTNTKAAAAWALAFWTLSLAACQQSNTSAGQEQPTGPEPFDPNHYEILSHQLGEADGEAYRGDDNAEAVVQVTRVWTSTPLTIHAIEAQFNVRTGDEKPAHLAIYPDFGTNFYDFGRETPLFSWEGELSKNEHDEQWLLVPLDEPIVLNQPQLLYLGNSYRGEEGQPVLATDEALSDDLLWSDDMGLDAPYSHQIAVLPKRGTDSGGFETVYFGGSQGPIGLSGDLMIRLYVERHPRSGEPWFRTEPEEGGSVGLPNSSSVAFGDCNDDGWVDVYTGALWINQEDGTFLESTEASGLSGGGAGAFGDYNNDGHLDLFVAGTEDQLFEGQGDCNFIDVTAASGIDDSQLFDNGGGHVEQNVPTPSAAWVDVNNDGLLDLYQANFMNFETGDSAHDRLWLNQGNGLFANHTDESGLTTAQGAGKAGRGVAVADWNNDGYMDIYASNYRLHKNYAWQNNGNLTFTNAGTDNWLEGHAHDVPPTTYYGHTIGSTFGDVDNDGDLDLFAANLAHPRFITFSDKSMFLKNQLSETGEATFENLREKAGMIYQETDSSPVFLDFDNDGLLDLFYTAVYPARPSYLYRNLGDFRFELVAYESGAFMPDGWGVAAADLDNDGDLDLVGRRTLINEYPGAGNWLQVQVEGLGAGATNRSAIGARVFVTTSEGTQMREISGGLGVGCSAPLLQHFGLGQATEASVRVEFPASGREISQDNVAANQRLDLTEPAGNR